jgi:RNA polymerase sigma-70 factor (ECF subfamily)
VASQRARFARPALIDGTPGIVVAPRGRLFAAIRLTIKNGLNAEIDVIGDAARLRELNVDVWED